MANHRRGISLAAACLLVAVLNSAAMAQSFGSHPLPHKEQVIRLKLLEGTPQDPGRAFGAPVVCNGIPAYFTFACLGMSHISESFAKQCGAMVLPHAEASRVLDPDGNPIYLGVATVDLEFGGREFRLTIPVMKDDHCQKPEKQGLLGYDVIHVFQWEVDPTIPTLTLRPLGTPPQTKPLAVISLTTNRDGCFANVRVRNVTARVAIMPGASFVQAGPELQHQWDLNSGKPLELQVRRFSRVRLAEFHGEDAVELAKGISETDLTVALLGDPKHPKKGTIDSGIGQCVLNRFVYCVDGRRRQLRLISRVALPTAQPRTPAAQHASQPLPATEPAEEGPYR